MDADAFFKMDCSSSGCCRPEDSSCPCRANDRDARSLRFTVSKDVRRRDREPRYGGKRSCSWGGALRNMTSCGSDSPFNNSRNDQIGRNIPIGYAAYVSPTLNRYDYKYYPLAGWRVAVPRIISDTAVYDLLNRIFNYGPQSAGYIRMGDTLVPASLGPGERLAVAESTVNSYRAIPLTL